MIAKISKSSLKRRADCSHVYGPSAALDYDRCIRGCGHARRNRRPTDFAQVAKDVNKKLKSIGL